MSDIETLNTNNQEAVKQEIIDEERKLEQAEQETNKELEGKTQEELNIEQENIKQRIQELKEKREELRKNIEIFLDKVVLIIKSGITPEEQKIQIEQDELFNLLPESVSRLIEENFNKFNFIDYKIAEVLLEEDLIGKEIENLEGKQDLIDEKIETEEVDEKKEDLGIEDIEDDLKEELELGDENTRQLEGLSSDDLNQKDLERVA